MSAPPGYWRALRLAALRATGMTVEEAARRAGISPGHLRRVLREGCGWHRARILCAQWGLPHDLFIRRDPKAREPRRTRGAGRWGRASRPRKVET